MYCLSLLVSFLLTPQMHLWLQLAQSVILLTQLVKTPWYSILALINNVWLASEGNKCLTLKNLTGFFKAMHIMLYKIWKLFKLYTLCLDDRTHKFTKNYVHKYPRSLAYENVTSSVLYKLTGWLHYSPSMKDFLPVWARIHLLRGEKQTGFWRLNL